MKRKICVITSTRAEYGFFKPLLSEFKSNGNVQLELIVTGTHLEAKYGYTIEEILNDKIQPSALIRIIENDTPLGILGTMANAIQRVGEELQKLAPDIIVLLGDRYETIAIASAAVVLGIPIAHISGGDVTYGAYDDIFRHCLTKMSNLHFTNCEEYRKRVIQLGEQPDTVFSVGSLSLENIKNLQLLSVSEINNCLGIDVENTLLVTFHPITMEGATQNKQFEEVLQAISEQNRYDVLFTKANADTNASELNTILEQYQKKMPKKIRVFDSLGTLKYLSVMKHCVCVLGNSSSGILEAPSFKVPTINIGTRQIGRIQANSVVNCKAEKIEILNALDMISQKKFRGILENTVNPYENNNTARNIAEKICEYLENPIRIKKFHDLNCERYEV